jgi:hypothetical protein
MNVDARSALKERRGLLGRPVEDVAQDQHRALLRRQELNRGKERDLYRLSRDHRGVGLSVVGGDPLQQLVGVRLQPPKIDRGKDYARRRRRSDLRREHPTGGAGESVETGICRDSVEPRAKSRAPLEALPIPPRAQERLLHQILRVLQRPEQAVAMDLQLTPVPLDKGGERGLVARPRRGDDRAFLGLGLYSLDSAH